MLILNHENKTYNLNNIPDEEEDVRYCVFDIEDEDGPDYFFSPLIFLESFHAPAAVLQIGPYRVQMPLDWSIVVCDEVMTDVEVMPITDLNDRGFCTMLYNPLKNMIPEVYEVNIINVFAEVKWFFPKMQPGKFLVVPVENGSIPKTMLFIKDKTRFSDHLDIAMIL